eukprot:gb/GECG01007822.1/.p1 GENE.gb/GECG01007822.1/~~gb/GECG01007822.1/.p1  ORF type:complete len:795 (+),score=118.92 gb/GECG01007822.1/:1-2385(+)
MEEETQEDLNAEVGGKQGQGSTFTAHTSDSSRAQGGPTSSSQHSRSNSSSERLLKERIKSLREENPGEYGLFIPEETTRVLQQHFHDYKKIKIAALRKKVKKVLGDMKEDTGDTTLPESHSPSRSAAIEGDRTTSGLNKQLYSNKNPSNGNSESDSRKRKETNRDAGARRKMARLHQSGINGNQQENNQLTDQKPRQEPISARYSDLGGIEDVLAEIRELIEYPLTHPEIYTHVGVQPPRGILLHGPPGCGKTQLALAIAGELNVHFRRINAPEIVSGMSGESEQKLRQIFDEAAELAPSLVFIDEIDVIAPKRESSTRGMERRMVAQLLTCMDNLVSTAEEAKSVIVIGATNSPDALDAGLRRAGRFDREIALSIPNETAREQILEVLTKNMKLDGALNLASLARLTPGYVGADLAALTKEAAIIAVNRVFDEMIHTNQKAGGSEASVDRSEDRITSFQSVSRFLKDRELLSAEELEHLRVKHDDFVEALKKVQPSCTREGFATVPDVTWKDVGALLQVREEMEMSIVQPIKHPERYTELGISAPAGLLLYGPPGCGKTLLAKAIASESHANFISVKGPELLDKYVGESERAVRQVFQRARASAPCIVFFDEMDALAPRRSGSASGSSGVSERVVNQLLTELDGLDSRKGVFIVAATNRPDIIDSAMLRPGRLDKLLFVPLPNSEERASILRTHVRNTPQEEDIDFNEIASNVQCERFSGADLAGLVREASMCALRDYVKKTETGDSGAYQLRVSTQHFMEAFKKVKPSVSEKDLKRYNALAERLQSSTQQEG